MYHGVQRSCNSRWRSVPLPYYAPALWCEILEKTKRCAPFTVYTQAVGASSIRLVCNGAITSEADYPYTGAQIAAAKNRERKKI
ncbi:hypothetical protein ACP70R_029490 [Stipagrostis hirtigluma subsp. patula]